MARVVVLGAGLAGLAVAARLADLRHDVVVVEQADTPGGQLRPHDVNGTSVDLGPTTFTMPAPLRELFRATGRPIEREVEMVPVDPAMQIVFPDCTVAEIPNASRAGTRRALDDALGSGAGAGWDGVVDYGSRLWQDLHDAVLGYARRGRTRVPSLRSFSATALSDVRLRQLLDWYATSVGEDPARAPASVTVLPYLEQTFGLWSVAGGSAGLIDAVHRRALERGAVVRTNARANAVDVGGGRVRSVTLDGGEVMAADVVVSAISPDGLRQILPRRALVRSGRTFARRPLPPPRSSFCVLIEADGTARGAGVRKIVVPPDDQNPALTVNRAATSTAGTVTWAVHADCAAHGDALDAVDWSAARTARAYADEVIAHVTSTAAPVGTPQATRLVRTPHDLEQTTGAPGGAIYGRPTPGRPAYLSRPGNRTRIRGLFLAGAGAHPGPGVAMTVISSGIVADLIGRA